MRVIVDTGFLLTLVSAKDKNHRLAVSAMERIGRKPVIPAPVLPEVFYMVARRIGYPQAIQLFDHIQGQVFDIVPLSADDMRRMVEIMRRYQDAQFDFVDTAIMALSERLNITQVCTFDRRDFSIFRPKHCPALELLP